MTKSRKLWCIPTDQGTGNSDTCLCEVCITDNENQGYARNQASNTDDIDPYGQFVDCTENEAVTCCICGYPEDD